MSAASRLIRRMLTSGITLAALVLFIPMSHCSIERESPFTLMNKATGFCLPKRSNRCQDVRWTTSDRLMTVSSTKCLGAQGKTVGSEVSLYDCDEKASLQKWECRNGTLLALKGQELYIEVKADNTIALSKTIGPNNHLTISGTSSGACTRTYREFFTIQGNAFGRICMFPFMYKDRWFGDCTTYDSSTKRAWCAVETKSERELWGYCPSSSTEHWAKNTVTGAYYQLNTQSSLTWAQAEKSCKQQAASLLSIHDLNDQAFLSALIGKGRQKLWIGVVQDPEHGWKWSNGKPFRYLKWSTGHPLPNPGYNCAFLDSAGEYSWQSSSCSKKTGHICYKDGAPPTPPQIEQGFCSTHWIPYNGHCFYLQRTTKTWSDAVKACRKEHGDLVSIRNVEDQGFVISQLGYGSNDELWIGMNDKRTEGLFEWSDHSYVSFTSWESGRPAVATDDEDCVLIRGQNGNWADRSCDEKHGFICMKQGETEPTELEVDLDIGCKAGWKKHGSYCYFVGTESKTFDEAKDDCTNSNSYLADVSNGVDNAFLVSLVGLRPERYFWLGLSNQKNIDEFVWSNTNQVKFTHWNAEMPGYQQGCVAMTTGILAGLWDVLPCTNKEKYICKHQAEGTSVTVPPPTQAPPKCAEGWNRVGIRNVCAKFFTGPRADEKTWFEARDYCRAIGGDLLSIHSSTDLIVARHGKAWIGLHAPDPTNGYVWSDGTQLNYQHWQEGEPNNFNNDESCVEFRMHYSDGPGSWNDLNCESFNDWLCQIRAGVTPKPPPNNTLPEYNITSDGWLEWRGSQYYISKASKAAEDARYTCQQNHGDLVSISSKDENVFLWKQVSRSYGNYYIGMSVDLDGSFWWMDSSPVGLQRWDDKQPNSNAFDENCVVMNYHMGYWRTTNCGHEHLFMCKRGGTPITNTTAAPTVPPKGGCSPKWTKFDSKCYNINSNKVTWDDARRQCINLRGNLVSIPTRRVQAFLTTKMAEAATTDLWIGLNSLNQDSFYWTDGKRRSYTNWGYSKNQRRQGTFYQRWNEDECVIMASSPNSGLGKWLIKSCNNTNGFICHRDLDPNIKAQPETTIPTIYVPLGNESIKIVTENMTWNDANKRCKGEQANLASLRNEWTKAYIELQVMNLKAPVWIGLNKEQTEGYFRYTDGWHLHFTNWAIGEPTKDRPCVYIDSEGQWRTAFCNESLNSVCMQSTDIAPTESTVYPGACPEDTNEDYHQSYSWFPFQGSCYLFVTEEIEWADAASSCVRHGGILASIEDPSEQQFIKESIAKFQDVHTSFWVGLYKTHKGTWSWLDKTVMDYTNWGSDEPHSDYGEIATIDGLWKSGRRWHDRAYICETPKVISTAEETKTEPHGGPDHRRRAHTTLVVVLVIIITSTLIAAAFFFYKRSPGSLPTFDNPLYLDSQRSQPDVVDTNKLIENAEVEHPEPIITL
ncbi:macrophage mannose receptor 1 [Betta splendens]|uniref:Macrophage mannose receptor 1 n=1 Tax=Betta splendens TaxID=158456 RepID=A0A6P7L143_BETSP|nr:macrophage mannose receptor 1 [Betta splendens]